MKWDVIGSIKDIIKGKELLSLKKTESKTRKFKKIDGVILFHLLIRLYFLYNFLSFFNRADSFAEGIDASPLGFTISCCILRAFCLARFTSFLRVVIPS